jgi:hypothetical protein
VRTTHLPVGGKNIPPLVPAVVIFVHSASSFSRLRSSRSLREVSMASLSLL